MKTPEELAEEHRERVWGNEGTEFELISCVCDFLAGYQAAKNSTCIDTIGIDRGTELQWISVKERLPEEGSYLVTCHEETYAIAEYDGIKWTTLNSIAYHPTVTHWMPLPTPPEDK